MIVAAPAAAADGAVLGVAPTAPPRVGTRNTAGTGGARETKRWLAAQGRPGRRFFLAAGLADVAATAGTVILSWYVAALIVAGVVAGGLAGHRLAGHACRPRWPATAWPATAWSSPSSAWWRAASCAPPGRSPRTGWPRRVPAAPRPVPATRSWTRSSSVIPPMSR